MWVGGFPIRLTFMTSAHFESRRIGPPLRDNYDVIVIGGGISGVQIARHAQGRGLRTVMFEARDYSSGTSSTTSKMIHGGLRYLEQYDFGVVQEAVKERRYLGIMRSAFGGSTQFHAHGV